MKGKEILLHEPTLKMSSVSRAYFAKVQMRRCNAKSPSLLAPCQKKAQTHHGIDSCRNSDYAISWINLLNATK